MLTAALQRDFWAQLTTTGLLVHSDRGGQYLGNIYRKLLHNRRALRSQGRRGDCYDNALAERLRSCLKIEMLELREQPGFTKLADTQYRGSSSKKAVLHVKHLWLQCAPY